MSQAAQHPANNSTGAEPAAGEVNVFYTGLPPYHPLALNKDWDPALVGAGVRDDAIALVETGYNVYVIAAGPEVPLEVISQKMRAKGVSWHITGIGMGVRTAMEPVLVHYFEDLVEMLRRDVAPAARQVFNTGPGSCVESVQYRIPLRKSGESQHGKLLGFEELFDGQNGPVPDMAAARIVAEDK